MIQLDEVSKSFAVGSPKVVDRVSLTVEEGELLVLLGSSGSGKTTLLRLINHLLEPDSGRVLVDGKEVRCQDPVLLRRRIGYVFQGIGLFSHLSVEDNVAMVPQLLGWPRARRRERARELLELVGLPPDDYACRLPMQLSGGQQQRVGVARALAADPKYLLMDEPFGALDAVTRDALQRELLDIKEKLSKTVVFVTHDIFEALTLADRIAVVHQGRLQQIGTRHEIVGMPKTDFVRELFARPAEQIDSYRSLQ